MLLRWDHFQLIDSPEENGWDEQWCRQCEPRDCRVPDSDFRALLAEPKWLIVFRVDDIDALLELCLPHKEAVCKPCKCARNVGAQRVHEYHLGAGLATGKWLKKLPDSQRRTYGNCYRAAITFHDVLSSVG